MRWLRRLAAALGLLVERGDETMVNGTPRKRGPVSVPALPDELVQWEIFIRLPTKEVLRCHAVCRSWCRLASDNAFLLAHHRRQPSLPLVFLRARSNEYTAHATVDALDIRRIPAARRPVLAFEDYNYSRRNFTFHASCDGLLLLSLSSHRFYLCNPTTRQWCELPVLTGGNVAALYPHRPSSEYRILYWKLANKCDDNVVYYVLTVGSSQVEQRQRCIGLPVASPSMRKDMSRWHLHAYEHPPVLLHDCLHWYSALDGKIVIFNTLAESFCRWIQSPIVSSSAHLLQMDGRLGIGRIDVATMTAKAWVLQDYEAEIWSSKYRTELPEEEMRSYQMKYSYDNYEWCLYGKVVSENGDMLLISNNYWSRSMFHCDSKGKLIEKLPWRNNSKGELIDPKVLGLCFKESLVRHVFLERKDGKRVKLPRFLQGL